MGTHTFDVCVSDGTASDCETINVTVTSTVTLIGDWKADEGSGTTLVNSSPLGTTNNGTILGARPGSRGQHGQAIRFDGTGDRATVTDNASLEISGAITMAAWVKPEAAGTQNLIKKSINGTTTGTSSRSSRPQRPHRTVRALQRAGETTYRVNGTTTYP